MNKIKLSKDIRGVMKEEIIRFFLEQKEKEISDFQAEIFLNFIIDDIGIYIYNEAIKDACAFMNEKVDDMYGLEKRIR
ncbi:DUF2164 family protein [Clostridium sp. UBA6640]|jgi:uncharacterized protein (DUF2164 family)|uniref:DUF2164 family protein n=1 Tax=Clostridium sp. UBA6640 TaxID=1946370 RepID=UPI0025BFCD9C|nr:DUF2164 family protein [Clostridium sp. UBA6640]